MAAMVGAPSRVLKEIVQCLLSTVTGMDKWLPKITSLVTVNIASK